MTATSLSLIGSGHTRRAHKQSAKLPRVRVIFLALLLTRRSRCSELIHVHCQRGNEEGSICHQLIGRKMALRGTRAQGGRGRTQTGRKAGTARPPPAHILLSKRQAARGARCRRRTDHPTGVPDDPPEHGQDGPSDAWSPVSHGPSDAGLTNASSRAERGWPFHVSDGPPGTRLTSAVDPSNTCNLRQTDRLTQACS